MYYLLVTAKELNGVFYLLVVESKVVDLVTLWCQILPAGMQQVAVILVFFYQNHHQPLLLFIVLAIYTPSYYFNALYITVNLADYFEYFLSITLNDYWDSPTDLLHFFLVGDWYFRQGMNLINNNFTWVWWGPIIVHFLQTGYEHL